jgi:hypothetical protein
MNELGELISWLYPQARPGIDFVVVQRGEGEEPEIVRWAVPGVNQPTHAYLVDQLPAFRARAANWRQRHAAKAAAGGGKADLVLLRAVLKTVMVSIAQDRQYMARLRQELVALGRNPDPAPPVRTWEAVVAAVQSAIDSGEGDPPAAGQARPGGQA